MTVDNLVSFFLYLLISYLINKNHNPNIDSLNHYSGWPPNAPAPLLLPVIPNEPKNSSTFNFQLSTFNFQLPHIALLFHDLAHCCLTCCLTYCIAACSSNCCLSCCIAVCPAIAVRPAIAVCSAIAVYPAIAVHSAVSLFTPLYWFLLSVGLLDYYSLRCITVHSAVLVPSLCQIAWLLFTPLYCCSFSLLNCCSLCYIAVPPLRWITIHYARLLFGSSHH